MDRVKTKNKATFQAFHIIHLRQRRMRVVRKRGEDDGGGHGEGEVGSVIVVGDGAFGGCVCGHFG